MKKENLFKRTLNTRYFGRKTNHWDKGVKAVEPKRVIREEKIEARA
jgi:hypothetical protein